MTTTTPKRATNLAPAMPRLAEKAGQDLARPLRATHDGLRAIDVWFRHHGDPFLLLEPLQFSAAVDQHRNGLDNVSASLSNAELIARLWNTFEVLNTRLQLAARVEQ